MQLLPILEWIGSNPRAGFLLLTILLLVSNIVCLPISSPIITATGTLFGLIKGFWLSYITFNLAIVIGCSASRYLFKAAAMKYIKKYESMKGISRAIELKGWKFITLLMLPPAGMPTSLISFAVGATTALPIHEYLFGSMVGSVFHIYVLVYFGSLLSSLDDIFKGNEENLVMKLVGFTLSLSIGLYAGKVVRDEIKKVASRTRVHSNTSSVSELSKLV